MAWETLGSVPRLPPNRRNEFPPLFKQQRHRPFPGSEVRQNVYRRITWEGITLFRVRPLIRIFRRLCVEEIDERICKLGRDEGVKQPIPSPSSRDDSIMRFGHSKRSHTDRCPHGSQPTHTPLT